MEGLEEAGSFVVALGAFRAVVGNNVVWELPLWAMSVCLLVPSGAVVRFGVGVVLVYII